MKPVVQTSMVSQPYTVCRPITTTREVQVSAGITDARLPGPRPGHDADGGGFVRGVRAGDGPVRASHGLQAGLRAPNDDPANRRDPVRKRDHDAAGPGPNLLVRERGEERERAGGHHQRGPGRARPALRGPLLLHGLRGEGPELPVTTCSMVQEERVQPYEVRSCSMVCEEKVEASRSRPARWCRRSGCSRMRSAPARWSAREGGEHPGHVLLDGLRGEGGERAGSDVLDGSRDGDSPGPGVRGREGARDLQPVRGPAGCPAGPCHHLHDGARGRAFLHDLSLRLRQATLRGWVS